MGHFYGPGAKRQVKGVGGGPVRCPRGLIARKEGEGVVGGPLLQRCSLTVVNRRGKENKRGRG